MERKTEKFIRAEIEEKTAEVEKMEGIVLNLKNRIGAKDALTVARQPTKLLNIIFRNIKEEAEMGAKQYICSFNTSHQSAEYVTNILTYCGYTVDVREHNEKEILVPETENTNECYAYRHVVFFVISWSDETPN